MSRHLGIRLVLLTAVLLLAGVGCGQYYNGAFSMGSDDYKVVKEYHRQREMKLIEQEKAAAALSSRAAAEQRAGGGRIVDPTRFEPSPNRIEPVTAPKADQPKFIGPDGANAQPGESQSNLYPQDPQTFVDTNRSTAPKQLFPNSLVDAYGSIPGERGAVSPLDSTGQIRRVSFTQEGADFDVTLDHSGEFLIYSSTRHRETADIYRQRIDGSAITQLTDDSSNDVMPTLSPDGKTIAFASDRSGNWDLYLMDADGGPAVQLTSDRTHDIHPTFSPDGKTIAYCSLGERSGQWQLVTIDVENPTTKRYIGHGLFPQWSPKGNTILYQRARERGTRWFSVWTVELDERGEAGSPTEIVWSPDYACITPSWSPSGKAVVFCTVMNPDADTHGRPAESDVWISRVNGSGRTRLTRGRFANLQPVWSGDNAIYFVSNRATDGVENIWALDPDDAVKVAFPESETGDTNTADVPTDTD